MKNHIIVKGIAVFLCSVMLFAAGISGIGLLFLTGMQLRDSNAVEEEYRSQIENQLNWSARELLIRYCAQNYGNVPDRLILQMYGDSAFSSNFRKDGVFYELRDGDGTVLESTYDGQSAEVFTYTNNYWDYPCIVAGPVQADNEEEAWELLKLQLPAAKISAAVPEEREEAEPTEPFEDPYADEYMESWQTEAHRMGLSVLTEYASCSFYASRMEQIPEMSLRIYVAPGAMADETAWTLLRLAANYQKEMIAVLGVGFVLFVLLAVYLCCSAGRSPGSDEICAGGLNRMPLDLYFGIDAAIILILLLLGVEGSYYLLRQGMPMVMAYYGYAGFLCCLLAVCFGFAFAAQVKMADWFILKNTLCGRCWKLVVLCWHFCWKQVLRLLGLVPTAVRKILEICLAILRWLWGLLLELLGWVKKQFDKLTAKVNRIYRMLPLTWQWLASGGGMILILVLGISSRRLLWAVASIVICGALVLYGANAFGTLLQSAKRMRSGDLEIKVDDKALMGSFQEFAEELNGLAGVAVVAAQKQLRSERMKTELITNVSHDIKTPLTSIINYVDLLRMSHTPEEEKMYLDILSRQSMRMKKLIEDLIEMSKASTGNMPVEITRVDASEAVNQALGEFSDKLEAAKLTVVYHQPEQEMMMYADGRLVWRAMSNVLSNAVKYAMPGTRVYVDLSAAEGKVVISVKNISRDPLNVRADELLERFVRGDSSRNTEGSGLGLNIAKSLMELQHGDLQLLVDGDLFKVTLIFQEAGE